MSTGTQGLRGERELSTEWLATCLGSLVSIHSVNGIHSEEAIAQRIARYLEGIGCELTFVESLPGRPSLAAVLRGTGHGPTLVLNGHMDTAPIDDVELWTVDPFAGDVRDGAVWGRGAVDMKGGLVCQIACARVLSRHSSRTGTLVLHFAMGEEVGEPGTISLLERGFVGDFGITTEPTSLTVAIAQRGVASFHIRIHGRSSHAASPHLGKNPINLLPDLLNGLERYNAVIGTRRHPLFASPTCTPTIVAGGVKQNAVPDVCELVVDRRMLPGESRETALLELQEFVSFLGASQRGLSITVEPDEWHNFEPAEIPADSQFASRVLDRVEDVTGRRPSYTGTPYGSDVRNLVNDAGMEAITFGPGDVSGCHCPDERLSTDELRDAALVITAVAIDTLCSAQSEYEGGPDTNPS